ncbi:MAG: F0F1 ATP synthase subunit B [Ignavibacteriaceae bacterium]|jgi:F-type H+-transporting ATPase subunit b
MLFGFNLQIIAGLLEDKIDLLEVNPGLIVWVILTFIVLLLVLKKVAWKPILSALDQREAVIKESLEKAEIAQEEAKKVLEENKANIQKAEEESKKIINQSREYAEKLKDQMLQDGKEQAKKIVDEATAEIERKRDAAFAELKTQVAEIAIQAAEKIMDANLDKEAQKKIANKFIGEITKN